MVQLSAGAFSLRALSNRWPQFSGTNPISLGEPCGADATVFSFVSAALCLEYNTESRTHAEAHPNLVSYRARLFDEYFPETAATGWSKAR
jgi:Glutathione S-transferase, C-terminal domain